MKISLLSLVAFALLANWVLADDFSDEDVQAYKNYLAKHKPNQKFNATRLAAFVATNNQIKEHNKKHSNGESTHHLGHNMFSDMTDDEKKQFLGAVNQDANQVNRKKRGLSTSLYQFNSTSPIFHQFSADSSFVAPASVDLTKSGWTEPVRNQGSCGSCWAFSASSVFSQRYYNHTGTNVVFSPQNLVDCAGIWGANGCNGGSAAFAFEYVQINQQTIESAYPYKAVQGTCARPSTPLYTAAGFVVISSNQASLTQAVAQYGAVSVSIQADLLMNYAGGVWNGITGSKTCDPTKIDHAVTVVGYGTDSTTNTPYWLVKNSWGPSWGESGYFRMTRSSSSLCGLYQYMYTVLF